MNRVASRLLRLASFTLLVFCPAAAIAEPATQPVTHRVLLVEYDHGHNRLMQVAADGKLEWEQKLPNLTVMFQRLPGGHILCPHGGQPAGVSELDAAHQVVWEFKSHAPEVLGGERLANGNSLVAEEGPCRVLEVNSRGESISSVALPATGETHHQVRRIHRLPSGNILAANEGDGAVREVDPNGKLVWEYKGVENVFEAIRLPSGNTLIGGGTQKRVIEVTPQGQTVWELKADEVPELNLTWITSLQVLPNGTLCHRQLPARPGGQRGPCI